MRITDFGLAALTTAVAGDDVRSGTPAYMAPEQLEGREVTTASDIYALGLVLYELFTGRKPFEGKTLADLTRQHREETPREPSRVVEDIDLAIERVILRCLDKDPRLRPPSALAVAAALPGGDPLAAALAAGETPSPEMVAASGAMEGLPPAQAWGWLLGAAAVVALALVLARTFQLVGQVSLDKPPQALEDRAREILGALGHEGAGIDSATDFAVNGDYLRYLEAQPPRRDRWSVLRANRPAALTFYYRQSPRALVAASMSGRVSAQDPPVVASGMAAVELDPQGRLTGFYSVPPQLESEDASPPRPVNWAPLFAEARLDASRFSPATPRWTPPFHSDVRAAWVGTDVALPDTPLRLEAAGYRGRPVSFRMVWEWTRAERMQGAAPRPGQTAANRFGLALVVATLGTAIFLARQNVRLGRGDRRGARRLAVVMLGGEMVAWALAAHHVADMGGELVLVLRGLGLGLIVSCLVWLLYLAIEPYVRRHWPDTLVSWTRLLAGRWRDPKVGRDVLVGAVFGGAVSGLVPLAHVLLPRWLGRPSVAPSGGEMLHVLLATRFVVGGIVDLGVSALLTGMLMALVLTMFRLALRREWLVAIVFMVVLGLQSALRSPLPFALALGLSIAATSAPLYLALRQGVLVAVVSLFVANVLLDFPVPPSPGHWSAGPAGFAVAVLAGLLVYAFRIAERPAPVRVPTL